MNEQATYVPKRRTRTSKAATHADSQQQAARLLDWSPATVNRVVNDPGWTHGKPSRDNPVDLAAIREHHAHITMRMPDEGGKYEDVHEQIGRMDPLKKVRVAKLAKEIKRLDQQIGLHGDLYVERAVARQQISSIIANTRSNLLSLPRHLSDLLDANGLLATGRRDDVEREIERAVIALCTKFASGMNDIVDRPAK